MKDIKLKKAKRIGRKWAFISTLSGLISTFFVWMGIANFVEAIALLGEVYVWIGILTSVVLSYLIGEFMGRQILMNRKYSVGKWIGFGFITTYVSCLVPLLWSAMTIGNAIIDIYKSIGMILYFFTIFGSIPILIFGSLFGSLLKMEIIKE